ncbi:MAG: GNAT family N-acetyltransferase [Anaerolineae bacterium]
MQDTGCRIQVREARLSDEAAIADLLRQLAEMTEGGSFSPAWVEANLAPMLEDDDYVLLVAEVQGQVVGLLTLHLRRTLFHPTPVALVDELVVDRACRNQGVGRRLVEEAIWVAHARSACELEVSTERSNQAAQAFYRRLGFGHEAVLMELEFDA